MIEYYQGNHPGTYSKPRPIRRMLTAIGWLLAGPFVVAAIAMAIGAAVTPSFGGASPLLTLLILTALALFARNTRRARAMIAVNYLEQAVRLNLPIPAMLAAAERAERGALRRRLGVLRTNLESGWFIGSALQRSVPGVPGRVVQLVSAAERVGQLPATLARLVNRQEHELDQRPMQGIMLRWYPMLMLLCIGPVFLMVMIFVMPKIKQIFHDFHLELPAAVQWALNLWDVLEIPLFAVAVIAIFPFCGRLLSELLPRRTADLNVFRALTDRLGWYIPPWRKVVRSRALADVCHVLAGATVAGQPMDRALSEAAEAADNYVLRRRMHQWTQAVTAGLPLAAAAREAKMPPLIVGMLRTAQGADATADVFAFLGRYYDSQFSTAWAILQGAAIPVMVCVLAIFVLILALAVFVPLAELAARIPYPKGVM
ncbi:MAG TPA: type II secretion system F family protein [Tepidisphaeraceae bacterium]|nr:type II secretion system F family protein [Tepidisphaeraceae bacterium]